MQLRFVAAPAKGGCGFNDALSVLPSHLAETRKDLMVGELVDSLTKEGEGEEGLVIFEATFSKTSEELDTERRYVRSWIYNCCNNHYSN